MVDYKIRRFYFHTLEPVHVGAGGYRLGRVDNAICREPGTMLPKIPGTSLAGAARAYAALMYGRPEAAGQHKKYILGKEKCPILYTFGTDQDGGRGGRISFGDAHILFFPVATMKGTVWVTTAALLNRWNPQKTPVDGPPDTESILVTDKGLSDAKRLNLGWILLDKLSPVPAPILLGGVSIPASSIAITHPTIFSQVVNSNLEVRTSVSISPLTGAAEKGALFTYEALPRDTVLACDVVAEPEGDGAFKIDKKYGTQKDLGKTWESPLSVATSGLELINPLGIGGMGTRGFGRMKCSHVDISEAV